MGAASVRIAQLDVLDHAQSQTVYDGIIKEYGRVDTHVLNPGRTQRALAMDATVESTQTIMDLNFMSFVALTKVVTPGMIKRGTGSLVVTSSIAGKMGTPVGSSYSASKWALHGYFDALRAEVSHLGIHVLLVCPGPVVSEITEHAVKGAGKEDTEYETENEVKMSTPRCTDLTLRAMHHKFDEVRVLHCIVFCSIMLLHSQRNPANFASLSSFSLHHTLRHYTTRAHYCLLLTHNSQVWVSTQPFLAITYISVYAPGVGRFLFKRLFGPARVNSFLSGGSVFDLKAVLRSLWE